MLPVCHSLALRTSYMTGVHTARVIMSVATSTAAPCASRKLTYKRWLWALNTLERDTLVKWYSALRGWWQTIVYRHLVLSEKTIDDNKGEGQQRVNKENDRCRRQRRGLVKKVIGSYGGWIKSSSVPWRFYHNVLYCDKQLAGLQTRRFGRKELAINITYNWKAFFFGANTSPSIRRNKLAPNEPYRIGGCLRTVKLIEGVARLC